SKAARTLVAWGVLERDSLMDDGAAGLRERDPARLEAHRLDRVLTVASVQNEGAANRARGREGAARDRSGVVIRDLQVDEADRFRVRCRVVRAARRRRDLLEQHAIGTGAESDRE